MRYILFFLFLCFHTLEALPKQSICLNMIVKNESKVITRCLQSVKPFITHWVIVDTGSTDGTQEIIKEFMKDIPGELFERPWKNFGENRTEALELAQGKGEYFLFMDADDWLEYDVSYELPQLTHDLYYIWRIYPGHSFLNTHFVKASLPWVWKGAVHEYIWCELNPTSQTLENIVYQVGNDGSSHSDPKKFLKYIALLEESLKKDPNNIRDIFSLAKSYEGADLKEKALSLYEKVLRFCDRREEVFWAMIQIGNIQYALHESVDTIIHSFYRAHRLCPARVEPVCLLAQMYNKQGLYALAYACIKGNQCLSEFRTKNSFLNLDWMEEYGLLVELSICAWHLGKYPEALAACGEVLKKKNIPASIKLDVEQLKTKILTLH